jgi:hypothetical protein
VTGTLAPSSVSNQWMAFGTDDDAAGKLCVANGTNIGGRCYFNDGRIFMISNTSSTIPVSAAGGMEHGTIDGNASIVFAPQGSLTGGSNDRLFFIQSSISNSGCTSGGSAICLITNAPLAKGATSFTTAAADGATITPGQWIIIEETFSTSGCCNYIDWVKVASVATVGGTSTVTLTQPLEMAFPMDTNNSIVDVVGFRPVNDLNSHTTIRNLTVYTPMMFDSTLGRRPNVFNTQGTYGLTLENLKCWDVAKNCLAADYDNAMHVVNNFWGIEGTGTEIASTVHSMVEHNTFAKQPSPINQNLSACAGGTSPSGLNVDLATAFSAITDNQIDGCQVGNYLLQGSHDNTLAHNQYGWISSTSAGSGCILSIGGYNNKLIANTCVGATVSSSTGILVEDSAVNPALKSNLNQAQFNEVGSNFTTAYSFTGTNGTDCYSFLSGGAQQGTCYISAAQNNTFSGTNTFWNQADATYTDIIERAGLTTDQVLHHIYAGFSGTQYWDIEKDAVNGFRFRWVPGNLPVLLFSSAGQTAINAVTSNICLGCSPGAASGGTQMYSGGTNPYPVDTFSGIGLASIGGDFLAYSNLSMAQVLPPLFTTFATANTGGTLGAGSYCYRVSSVNLNGESLAQTEQCQTVPIGTSTNTVTVNWFQQLGATGYNVYGRTTGAELLMTPSPLSPSVETFVDTGSVTPSGALPGANTTRGGITLTGTKLTGDQGAGALLQHSTGSPTNGAYVQYDSTGNAVSGPAGSAVPQVGTPTVNQAACIKSAGPPVVIGYCSTVVGAGGSCTCN